MADLMVKPLWKVGPHNIIRCIGGWKGDAFDCCQDVVEQDGFQFFPIPLTTR